VTDSTSAAEGALVSKLTERQRETLRLTYLHKTSKEIAQIAGVTPFAIDAQIARAMRTLSVGSRIEAASAVMRHSPGAYERLAYQSPALAETAANDPTLPLSNDVPSITEDGVEELPATYTPPPSMLQPQIGRRSWSDPDGLTPLARAALIPVAAFLLLAVVFTLLAGGQAASAWVQRIFPVNLATD
jgi:DNA-binding CsgD family transcriptional regulator